MSAPAPPCSGEPGGRRRPLTSTSDRSAPSPRRFTVAVPVAPFDFPEFWNENTCGRRLSASSTRTVPCDSRSSARVRTNGLVLVSTGFGIRVPVTTMSASSSSCAGGSTPVSASSAMAGMAAPASSRMHAAMARPIRSIGLGIVFSLSINRDPGAPRALAPGSGAEPGLDGGEGGLDGVDGGHDDSLRRHRRAPNSCLRRATMWPSAGGVMTGRSAAAPFLLASATARKRIWSRRCLNISRPPVPARPDVPPSVTPTSPGGHVGGSSRASLPIHGSPRSEIAQCHPFPVSRSYPSRTPRPVSPRPHPSRSGLLGNCWRSESKSKTVFLLTG